LKRLVFGNDYEGFTKLLDQAEALRVRHGLKKVVYGMEATANYHKPLGEFLIHLGRTVVLVSGVTVEAKPGVVRWAMGQA
jgi:transposase